MAKMSRLLALAATCVTLAPCRAQATAAAADCFASGSIVGAVLGTFFATAVTTGLVAYALWWFYNRRHNGRQKGANGAESGFDNPCFDSPNAPDAVDAAKPLGQGDAKTTSWTPLRFFSAPKTGKKRALDDSFVSEREHVAVQLRGHDFTGLGFNVTGNMRDGIYVKDILNRGPAFESGRIAQGDKILGVTISFRHIVYEDALTILSYASPYDVTLELEKGAGGTLVKQRKAASAGSLASAGAASVAAASAQLPAGPVVHPLYRSQSIDDLSKVGRDASVRADVRIPNLSGGLIRSKLLGKAHVELDAPKCRADAGVAAPEPGKLTKFGVKVLPDLKMKTTTTTTAAEVSVTDLPLGLGAVDVQLPKVEVHAPKPADVALDIDVPDSGASVALPKADITIDVPQVKLPDVKLPDVKRPEVDLNAPDVSISVDVPDASIDVGKDVKSGFSFKFPKFGGGGSGKSVKLDAADVEAPSLDVALPEASIEVDAKLKKGGGSGGAFKMPKLSMKKRGDASFDVKGAAPSVSVEMPEVNVDAKAPKAPLAEPVSVEAKKSNKMGFSMPKFHMGAKGHAADAGVELGVDAPRVKLDLPDVDVQAPQVDVDAPSLSVDAKKGKMAFSLPKFGLGGKAPADVELGAPGVDVELPKVELESGDHEKDAKKKSKFGFSLKMPKIGAGANLPDAELSVDPPKLDVNVPKADIELPGKVDVNLPKVDVEFTKAEVELPKVDVELPKLAMSHDDDDDEKKTAKFGIGFKMPKFGGASAAAVDVDLGAAAPKVDVPSVEIADASTEIAIGLPQLDVALPSIDVKAHHSDNDDDDEDGKKKSSKFGFGIKMPKFGFGAASVGAEASAGVDVTPPNVSVDLPSVDVGVKRDESDDDEDGSKKEGKLRFGVKMPKFGVSAPQVDVDLPKVDVELPSVEVKDDVDSGDEESGKKKGKFGFGIKMPKFGVSAPDVDVDLPKVDVELPSVEMKDDVDSGDEASGKKKGKLGFGIKMPKFGVSAPDVDVDLPKVDVELPSVEVRDDDDSGDEESGKKKGKLGFGIKMPKFGLNAPDVDVNLPKTNVDLPSVDVNVTSEESDNENGDKKKGKFGFGIKMPKFGLNAPDVDVSLPKTNVELPSVDVNVKSDESDNEDGDKKKGKFGFGIKMPKFGVSAPEVDVDLPKVDVEVPSVEVGLPSVEVEMPNVDVALPSVDVSANLSDDDEGEKKKFGIGFKMPKFGFGSSSGAELDVGLPKVDVATGGPDEKTGGFSIKLPKFGVDKADVELAGPSVGVDLPDSRPSVKVDVELPTASVAIADVPSVTVELPDVAAIEAPKVDLGVDISGVELASSSIDGKKSKMGFSLPKFHVGAKGGAESKDVELKIEAPELKADVPGVKVELPSVDVPDVELPSVSVEGKKSKMGFHLPKFHLGGKGHGEAKDVELSVEAPSVDVKLPALNVGDDDEETGKKKKSIKLPKFGLGGKALDVDASLPGVELELPKVEIDADADKADAAKKKKGGFHIKMPKFGASKAELDVHLPDVSVELPDAKLELDAADATAPALDVELPQVGAELDPKLKKESLRGGFDFKMPKLSMKKKGDASVDSKGPSISVELPDVSAKLPEASIDVEAPSVDLPSVEGSKKSKMGFSMPKFHIGGGKSNVDKEAAIDLGIDAASVSVDLPDVDLPDLKAPEIAADADIPSVDVGKKGKISLNMPKFGGKFEASAELPKVDVPDVSLDVPDIGVELTGPEVAVDVHPPEVALPDVELPSVSLGEAKKQKVGFHLPKFGLGAKSHGVDVELPDVDVDAGEHDRGDAKKKSKFGIGFKMPKMSANAAGDAELSVEAPKLDVNVPAKVDVELPGVELLLPKVDASLKTSASDDEDEAEGGAKKKKGGFHIKMPKFGAPKVDAVGASLPSVVDVPAPEASIDIAAPKLSVDDGPKKRYKFGFGAPKVHDAVEVVDAPKLPKLDPIAVDVQFDGAKKVDVDFEATAAVEQHDDLDEDKKKKSKFSIKMPKFHMKKRATADVEPDKDVAVGLDCAPPDDDDDNHDDGADGKKRAGKISVKMPKFGMKKPNVELELPDLDKVGVDVPGLEVDAPDVSVELPDVKLSKPELDVSVAPPRIQVDIEKPDVSVDLASVDLAGVAVELPKVELDIDAAAAAADDADDDKKKGNKFSFKLPKFHLGGAGKHHGDVPGVKVELPEGGAGVDVQPASLELDVGDAHDDESDGAKKKTRFGIKLPKFQTNKPHAAELSAGKLDVDAGVSLKLPSASAELETEDMDVVLPKVELELPGADASIDVDLQPDAKTKKAKFSFKKTNFKMPKMPGMSGKGVADAEPAPDAAGFTVQLDVPTLDAPRVDLSLDADVKTDEPRSDGEFTVDFPKMDIALPQVRPAVELPSVEAALNVEPVKKSPFIDKMPELDPIAAGIDLTLAKAKIDLGSDRSDDDGDDDDDDADSYKLGIRMPRFSFGAKGAAEAADANFSLDLPSAPSVSGEASELEGEAGLKIGAKMPKLRQRVPDVVLPQVQLKTDVDVEGDEGNDVKIELKKPKFGIKLPTIELGKPRAELDVAVNLPRIDVQPTYAAESTNFELEMPHVELDAPSIADAAVASIDAQMENIDAEVAKTKAQLAQLQAELDVHAGAKKEPDAVAADVDDGIGDDDDERKTKSSGFHLGLKMPKFHLGRDKHEAKLELEAPSVSLKSNSDEASAPGSLEMEPARLEAVEKEKKKFHLKMPKFQSKTHVTSETGDEPDAEPKSFKVGVKAPKVKSRKKKGDQQQQPVLSGEESDEEPARDAPASLLDVEMKLPRVQVYKNVEYEEGERAHESSADDEDETKDIKKNIGARFGVKLKKPKMFSSTKVEISSSGAGGKGEQVASASLQPEWKLPRVDLRRSSKSSDQELSVDVELEIDQQRLEQLSPSERAEAIRRDAKASAGIRLHSPSYISKMHSPRSKKSSLEMMDADSSPRLLSVTRLDSAPGGAAQVPASQVPATLLAASDAAKLKRGPPAPVKRSVIDPFRVAINVNASPEPVVEDAATLEPKGGVCLSGQPSDTDVSVTTSLDSAGAQEAPSRKASSLGDLTRIPPSGGDDGSLERTVSLDFKPVPSLGASARAIYNLAVHDLSRVGEDSDEDYSLSRKRSAADSQVTLTVAGESALNRTVLTIETGSAGDVRRPLDAESLWFGSAPEGAETDAAPVAPLDESLGADAALTTTSLGTSPSETSSGSEGCPTTPASPEPAMGGGAEPDDAHQVENGRQFTAEIVDASTTSNRTITIEMTPAAAAGVGGVGGEGEQQPQPLTDLNPSAGSFAAVRNRFEQLSGPNNALNNGTEPALGSPGTRTRIAPQTGSVVKRLSGTFEESPVVHKTIMQMAPEVSEGALSRTVIISSLHLERTPTDSASVSPPLGPESPVPKLEPPC